MPESLFIEENENPNHVRETGRFCEYLGRSFPIKYSKVGIIYFKCEMYQKDNPELACLETRLPTCFVRNRLMKIIKKLK